MRQGDFYFLKNAFENHLLPQAAALANEGHMVWLCWPDSFQPKTSGMPANIHPIALDPLKAQAALEMWEDPSNIFYRDGTSSELCAKAVEFLNPVLPEAVDAVLLWENPVPFLEVIYPEALIVHQMPGGFARAPYPATVVFDPAGLYRKSSFYAMAQNPAGPARNSLDHVRSFKELCQQGLARQTSVLPAALKSQINNRPLSLLPLQISDHYAFQIDTGFRSQQQLCLAALEQAGRDRDVFITEYISPLYAEPVMDPEFTKFVQDAFPRTHFSQELRDIPNLSQQVLPEIAEVITATSGLGIQALAFDLPVKSIGNTFLGPLAALPPGSEQANQLLHFCLTRNQPLAKKVKEDGAFLTVLLEEMIARKGREPHEAAPDFNALDPGYDQALLDSFRIKANRQSVQVFAPDQTSPSSQKFEEHLATLKPSCISFDLFDTLILRGLEAPADLFVLLRHRALAEGLSVPFDLEEARLGAELSARAEAKGAEITLTRIYDILAQSLSLPAETRDALEALEIALEISCAQPRPAGMALWDLARKADASLLVASDMYLPEHCIQQILEKIGVEARLYLSSTAGVTKKSGKLFDKILNDNALKGAELLHIGDTLTSDIEPAQARGIRTWHLPKSIGLFRKHAKSPQMFDRRKPIAPLGRSVVVAALSHKLFDCADKQASDPMFDANAQSLGYGTIGPLVLGFACWLRDVATQDGITQLHFLSREGKLLRDAFEILESAAPSGIKSNYLWGSRRAIRVASLQSAQDVRQLASLPIAAQASLGQLIEGRFGLAFEKIPKDALHRFGFGRASSLVGTSARAKQRFADLATEISPLILEHAKPERSAYLNYLAHAGLSAEEKIGIVDVGWEANMQGGLSALLQKPLFGYYCATRSGALRWQETGQKLRAYLHEFADANITSELINNRLLVEHLLCDISPSVRSIRQDAHYEFYPVFQMSEEPKKRTDFIGPLHDGAREFCQDVSSVLGSSARTVQIPADVASAPLSVFLNSPDKDDAGLILGQSTRDSFSGEQGQVFLKSGTVHEASRSGSYWKAGAQAVNEANEAQELKTDLSMRARLALFVWLPILKPHLSDEERDLWTSNPKLLFRRASHPVMVWAGKSAGLC